MEDSFTFNRLNRNERLRNLVPLRFHDYVEADDQLRRIERQALRR